MSDPWRYRCPEGHAALQQFSEGYRCSACDDYYAGDPYDAAETEFPVAGVDPEEPITIASVVRGCYRQTGDTDTTVAAIDLDDRSSAVGKVLNEARKHGLVERIGASSPYLWRLTEQGYRKARPLRNSTVKELIADQTDEVGMSPVGAEFDE